MAKAIIIYETAGGKTRIVSDFIADEIRAARVYVDVATADGFKSMKELKSYDAFVFGSDTIVGNMLPGMEDLLVFAEKAGLTGKVGGAFGTFGCSGEGPMRIYNAMRKKLRMDMAGGPLMLKKETPAEIIRKGHEYGREIAKKFKGNNVDN